MNRFALFILESYFLAFKAVKFSLKGLAVDGMVRMRIVVVESSWVGKLFLPSLALGHVIDWLPGKHPLIDIPEYPL